MATRAVSDVMTKMKMIVQLPSETSVVEAAKAMRSRQIGDVVVVDRGNVAGVVTDRDIVVRAIAEDKDPASTPLRDICSGDLVTIDQEASTSQAADLMRTRAIRRLLVTGSDGSLTGVVSIGDLAAAMDPHSALGAISTAAAND